MVDPVQAVDVMMGICGLVASADRRQMGKVRVIKMIGVSHQM